MILVVELADGRVFEIDTITSSFTKDKEGWANFSVINIPYLKVKYEDIKLVYIKGCCREIVKKGE
jgi:hypothetical protein